ncbi:MAG: LPS assembly lipoprotein LptE [Thermodesulfobacteriota bacterium]|nr:LPS assembly lipoprotein LptE [Thermodesulfobacteriota bacterium]
MGKKIFNYGVLLFLFLACSCGYRFSGAGALPGSVTKVYVEMFENRSFETGAETLFTNAFISELLRQTDADVVDKESAQAFIFGTIRSINIGALTRTHEDLILERRVTALFDLKMTTRAGKVLFAVNGFSEDDEYRVSKTDTSSAASEKGAVEKIAERISEKLVSRLKDNF